MATVAAAELRSISGDVTRTMTLTDPAGVRKEESVKYRVERKRSGDGVWSTRIVLPKREPLFQDPSGAPATPSREPVELEYANPRVVRVRYSDGSTSQLEGAERFRNAAVEVGTGRRLSNPILDNLPAPSVDDASGASSIVPFVVTRASTAAAVQRLTAVFGEATRDADGRLAFHRQGGGRDMNVTFDEGVGAVVEHRVTEGVVVVTTMRRSFIEVAPDVFVPRETRMSVPAFGGRGRVDIVSRIDNISIAR